MMAAQESTQMLNLLKQMLVRDKVVIFSKSHCPYCDLAKDVFKKVQQPVRVIELDKRNDGPDMQKTLALMTQITTVPQVFIHGKCVGGGTDVKALYKTGRLSILLSESKTAESLQFKQDIRKARSVSPQPRPSTNKETSAI